MDKGGRGWGRVNIEELGALSKVVFAYNIWYGCIRGLLIPGVIKQRRISIGLLVSPGWGVLEVLGRGNLRYIFMCDSGCTYRVLCVTV